MCSFHFQLLQKLTQTQYTSHSICTGVEYEKVFLYNFYLKFKSAAIKCHRKTLTFTLSSVIKIDGEKKNGTAVTGCLSGMR